MHQTYFLCDAIYRGSDIVEGTVSPNKLCSLAEGILHQNFSNKSYAEICIDKIPRGERCQLGIDDEQLRVASLRKDEGFESDSEASSTASGCVVGHPTTCPSSEIKVIKDHVLRLEKLIRQDSGIEHTSSKSSTNLGNSSFSSEERSVSSLNSSSGAESEEESLSSQSNQKFSPELGLSDLPEDQKKKTNQNTSGDNNFLLKDILFCHVITIKPKIIVVVVKCSESDLVAAHFFECLSQDAARTLYNCYYTASNKYKLDKYRLHRNRITNSTNHNAAISLDRIINGINVSFASFNSKNKKEADTKSHANEVNTNSKINVEKNHSDATNRLDNTLVQPWVSRIQPKSQETKASETKLPISQITRVEISNEFKSLNKPERKYIPEIKDSISALDCLSLHSKSTSNLNNVEIISSCPNSLINSSVPSRKTHEVDKSSRQRQTPLFMKKEVLAELDEIFARNEVPKPVQRSRNKWEENKRKEHKELDGFKSNLNKVRSCENIIDYKDAFNKGPERSNAFDRHRFMAKSTTDISRSRFSYRKRPAPNPPVVAPKPHPTNPSLMLVPTKSGQENTRSHYPKESHIMRGSRIVRIDYPIYPPWNMNSDLNKNAKRIYYATPNWMSSHEYHASRNNPFYLDRIRSRSKSPVSRPIATRYDIFPSFKISQKIKDFSESVIQSWKSNSSLSQNKDKRLAKFNNSQTEICGIDVLDSKSSAVKPAIKNGKKLNTSFEHKKVTFNTFATVQMMNNIK